MTAAVVCADDVCVIYSLLTALTNIRERREANTVAWNSKKNNLSEPKQIFCKHDHGY